MGKFLSDYQRATPTPPSNYKHRVGWVMGRGWYEPVRIIAEFEHIPLSMPTLSSVASLPNLTIFAPMGHVANVYRHLLNYP